MINTFIIIFIIVVIIFIIMIIIFTITIIIHPMIMIMIFMITMMILIIILMITRWRTMGAQVGFPVKTFARGKMSKSSSSPLL